MEPLEVSLRQFLRSAPGKELEGAALLSLRGHAQPDPEEPLLLPWRRSRKDTCGAHARTHVPSPQEKADRTFT